MNDNEAAHLPISVVVHQCHAEIRQGCWAGAFCPHYCDPAILCEDTREKIGIDPVAIWPSCRHAKLLCLFEDILDRGGGNDRNRCECICVTILGADMLECRLKACGAGSHYVWVGWYGVHICSLR